MPKTKVMSKPIEKSKPHRAIIKCDIPDLESEFEIVEDTEEHGPLPQIDRRHLPRTPYQTTAWLAPADDTGAIRRPIIRTRDLNILGCGFRTRQDVSALGDAILRLPAAAGKCVSVACRVRRSLEQADGWFDGLVVFLKPQPTLALPNSPVAQIAAPVASHNTRHRKSSDRKSREA